MQINQKFLKSAYLIFLFIVAVILVAVALIFLNRKIDKNKFEEKLAPESAVPADMPNLNQNNKEDLNIGAVPELIEIEDINASNQGGLSEDMPNLNDESVPIQEFNIDDMPDLMN